MSPPADAPHSRPAVDIDRARAIATAMGGIEGALMPILHALQSEFGYIDAGFEPVVADVLNLTRAEVHGVVTFYRDFRRVPPARHRLALCRAEACQSTGSEALARRA